MSTPFVSRRRVEFHDTDMAGIVHFSNFFRYMEVAEVEFLRERGLAVTWRTEGRRIGFPRVSASCDFFKPIRFEDEVEIAVTVERVGAKSVTYSHEFRRGGEVVARGKVTAVCVRVHDDNRFESLEIPDDVRAKLLA
jgi:acyl-CoA thioester hydrolase